MNTVYYTMKMVKFLIFSFFFFLALRIYEYYYLRGKSTAN